MAERKLVEKMHPKLNRFQHYLRNVLYLVARWREVEFLLVADRDGRLHLADVMTVARANVDQSQQDATHEYLKT